MRRYARITGTGSYLPPRRLTNHDLAAELAQRGIETSDEWIVERTGIRARHFAAAEQGSSDLAAEAGRRALGAPSSEPTREPPVDRRWARRDWRLAASARRSREPLVP